MMTQTQLMSYTSRLLGMTRIWVQNFAAVYDAPFRSFLQTHANAATLNYLVGLDNVSV